LSTPDDERCIFEQTDVGIAMPADADLPANTAIKAGVQPSNRVWFGGVLVRTVFLIVLTVITARVASPQMEHFSSLHETPGDLIRVLLGFGVCGWFIVNLFILPKDPGAYRTWMYLGVTVLPLALLCAVVVW
jgi:hypothetical protein